MTTTQLHRMSLPSAQGAVYVEVEEVRSGSDVWWGWQVWIEAYDGRLDVAEGVSHEAAARALACALAVAGLTAHDS